MPTGMPKAQGASCESALLCKTKPEDSLLLYVVVSYSVVSLVLIKEEEAIQRPMYYISRALTRSKKNYLKVEKVAFAIVIIV